MRGLNILFKICGSVLRRVYLAHFNWKSQLRDHAGRGPYLACTILYLAHPTSFPFSSYTMAFVGAPLATLRTTLRTASISPASHVGARHAARRRVRMAASGDAMTWPVTLDGRDLRVGIVSTRWHLEQVLTMVDDMKATLSELGVSSDNIPTMQVPGCFELPMAARLMISAQKVDAVVCVGVLIKGDTDHYGLIASSVTSGLMDLQLTTMVPVVFGVLTCANEAQVVERVTGEKKETADWARAAVEMATLRKSQMGGVTAGKKSVGFF